MFSVACVIPCFNDSATLGRAISSAVNQSHPPSEILILDDASTDGTRFVADDWAARSPLVKRYTYPGKSADWVQAMHQSALSMTTATHLHFLGANDYLLSLAQDRPGHFYELASRYPDAGIVFGDWYIQWPPDKNGKVNVTVSASQMLPGVPSPAALQRQLSKPQFCEGGPTLIVRRDVLQWLVDRDFHLMGTWHDSIGFSTALWVFGGAYIPVPSGVLVFNPDSYGERHKKDPVKSLQMWDAVRGFLQTAVSPFQSTLAGVNPPDQSVLDCLLAKVWNSLSDEARYNVLTRSTP